MSNPTKDLTPLERIAMRLAEMDGHTTLDLSNPNDWDTAAYMTRAKEVAKVMFNLDGNESESCWYCGRHIQESWNTNV